MATIFASTLIFGDKLTIINTVGLCITLFGIGLYNWLKLRKATQQAHKEVRDQELEVSRPSNESEQHRRPHLYSMVAESTPILLVDGAMTNYRDSIDSDDDHKHSREQYELR